MSDLPSSILPPAESFITNRLRELLHRLEHSHQPDTGRRDERETYARIIQALQRDDASTHLQRQLHESELNVKRLQRALDRATDKLDSRERKIQKLSKELEDYLYKSRMRKNLITQKNGKIEELEQDVRSLNARIKELEDKSRRRARHTGALETEKSEQGGRVATLRVEAEDKKEREKDRKRKSARATASSQTHVPDARARRQQRMHQEDPRVAASSAGTKRRHRRWF